ncbi:MAG: sulfatase-like hydrolase/transferase [Opitutaceae bacterium]
MKNYLSIFSLFLIAAANLSAKQPNVVLIFADDLGYGDLGCYGATKLQTPNIDQLAAEGIKFTDAHSASAVCTPSRYGLLTGQYPLRAANGKGIWGPAPVEEPLMIDTEMLTIADIFKESGYDTAVIGKWHLGFKSGKNDWQEPLSPGPQDLGFDYYFGMPIVNSAPPYVYVENDRIVGSDPADPLVYLGRNAKGATPITPIPKEAAQRTENKFGGAVEAHKRFNDYEVGTTLTEKATDWIESRARSATSTGSGQAGSGQEAKPFFLYFSTTNVHHPFTPAKQFQGTSQAGPYGDFVHELDWIVGEVRKSLEATGVADNTLIIFTSDNGGMFNLGGRRAAELGHKINGNLLGSKFGIWEGGHRVPFIAWWPGQIEAGAVSDQLFNSVDLMATFAAVTGRELAADEQQDSINMLPALTGNPTEALRTEMVMTPNKPTHTAIRKGKWMFIPAQNDGGFRGSKPHQHAWGGPAVTKLVNTPNSDIAKGRIKKNAPKAQLYDLEADRNQTKNVYNEYPEVVAQMEALLADYKSGKK